MMLRAALAMILAAQPAVGTMRAHAQTVREDEIQELSAELAGEKAGPYPADPDGEGSAQFTISLEKTELCYELRVSDIHPAGSAHLHLGHAPRLGPIRLELEPPIDGTSSGCVRTDRDLLRAMVKSPAAFYVDVHNAEYAGAALRGQLER